MTENKGRDAACSRLTHPGIVGPGTSPSIPDIPRSIQIISTGLPLRLLVQLASRKYGAVRPAPDVRGLPANECGLSRKGSLAL